MPKSNTQSTKRNGLCGNFCIPFLFCVVLVGYGLVIYYFDVSTEIITYSLGALIAFFAVFSILSLVCVSYDDQEESPKTPYYPSRETSDEVVCDRHAVPVRVGDVYREGLHSREDFVSLQMPTNARNKDYTGKQENRVTFIDVGTPPQRFASSDTMRGISTITEETIAPSIAKGSGEVLLTSLIKALGDWKRSIGSIGSKGAQTESLEQLVAKSQRDMMNEGVPEKGVGHIAKELRENLLDVDCKVHKCLKLVEMSRKTNLPKSVSTAPQNVSRSCQTTGNGPREIKLSRHSDDDPNRKPTAQSAEFIEMVPVSSQTTQLVDSTPLLLRAKYPRLDIATQTTAVPKKDEIVQAGRKPWYRKRVFSRKHAKN